MELTGNVAGLIKLAGGGSDVEVTPIGSTGTKIATITVDGVDYDIYAPEGSEVSVTPIVSSGVKIATITIDGVESDLYAPEGSDVEVTPIVSSGVNIATITIDGTSYDIYAPAGGGGDPLVYSTTEHKVGSWNGSDLYQKSYFFAVSSPDLTRTLDNSFSTYTPRTFDIGLYDESEKSTSRILFQSLHVYNSRGELWIEGSLQSIDRINYAVVTVNYTK